MQSLAFLSAVSIFQSGCFLDSMGSPPEGGAGGAEPIGGSDPVTTSSSSTTTGGGDVGGAGAAGGGGNTATGGQGGTGEGGEGGEGGAPPPPCEGYLDLDGEENDVATAGSDDGLDADAFSFGARIRLDALPSNFEINGEYDLAYVFERWSTNAGGQGYYIGFYDSADTNGAQYANPFVGLRGNGNDCVAYGNAPLPLNQWHYIAGSFDPDNGGVLTFYFDGVAIGTGACSGDGPLGDFGGTFAVGVSASGIDASVDDVFLRASTTPLPPGDATCESDVIAAFTFDDDSLASSCAVDRSFVFAPSPNDPTHVCEP
ncbi:MAG: LamG domain-containing protein [Polyangiaceae bacterium]|nr:LamG domain-containing protein [Polyangiaceae bacterium]